MRVVLVSGLIGSGKSEVCRHLQKCGFPVYCCDERMKALYRDVPGLLESCEKAVGAKFEDFAKVIFSSGEKLLALEALALPALKKDLLSWIESQKGPVCFVESATASSKTEFAGVFNLTVLVRADKALRIQRNPKAAERSELQNEPASCDFVIENNADLNSLYEACDRILDVIL